MEDEEPPGVPSPPQAMEIFSAIRRIEGENIPKTLLPLRSFSRFACHLLTLKDVRYAKEFKKSSSSNERKGVSG
jgi:hypothetical protein